MPLRIVAYFTVYLENRILLAFEHFNIFIMYSESIVAKYLLNIE